MGCESLIRQGSFESGCVYQGVSGWAKGEVAGEADITKNRLVIQGYGAWAARYAVFAGDDLEVRRA